VIAYAATHGTNLLPQVRPTQLSGIEINPYAQQLAQVVIWIGYLQWKYQNGFPAPRNPVLEPIDTIREMDAILDLSDPEHPKEPEWPKADFIVGNPPFLGTKKLRSELGDRYADALFAMYGDRIPNFSDLCCYWFEKGRAAIERQRVQRAGLLATQGIRGGLNRKVLERIRESGEIFFAESDRNWILDGAMVHVSIIGFDDSTEKLRSLDGVHVGQINANLTALTDTTKARHLPRNKSLGFIADVKAGQFDLPDSEATSLLRLPNPNGKPNSDVLRPWVNGRDVVQRPRDYWIIDFGAEMTRANACKYEALFKIVEKRVYPERAKVKRKRYREWWWLHAEPCAVMRTRLNPLSRFLVTTTVSKHRLFAWLAGAVLPDHQLVAFANDGDDFFGILQSRIHEMWAMVQGTQVRDRESGFRYTPTTCFETFPLPNPTATQGAAIAEAARELDRLRTAWLNPPEWVREEILEFPGSADGPWRRYVHDPDARGIGTVRYPRLVAKDAEIAKQLAKRTLTNLYNERPTWLDLAHRRLDEAVFAAYGWDPGLTDDQLLEKLLKLNLERAAEESQ
jgi:type II restriction/modification system DNA methylase subunit YeeA